MRKRGVEAGTAAAAVAFLCAFSSSALLSFAPAFALGDLRYENPIEQATHLGGPAAVLVGERFGGASSPRRWMVEGGEILLFDVDGLRSSCLRVGFERSGAGALLSAARLSSPVGSESFVRLEPFYVRGGRFGASIVVDAHRASFDGFSSSVLAAVGAGAFAPLGARAAVGYTVENLRVSGIETTGAESKLFLVAFPGSRFVAVGLVRADRTGRMSAAIAARVRMAGEVAGALGYDEDSAVLRGAMSFGLGKLGFAFALAHHPVLGLSESVFLSYPKR